LVFHNSFLCASVPLCLCVSFLPWLMKGGA
jgi:hypothetical protein